MGSVFVHLAELARGVRAPDGTISTSAFLELCQQVLPVLGASLPRRVCASGCGASTHGKHLLQSLPSALGASACAAGGLLDLHTLLCRADKLGTGMVIVRSDIGGNIKRLAAAQARNPERYADLFHIALDEVARGQERGTQSDTNALLWLKRCRVPGLYNSSFMSAQLLPLEPASTCAAACCAVYTL